MGWIFVAVVVLILYLDDPGRREGARLDHGGHGSARIGSSRRSTEDDTRTGG